MKIKDAKKPCKMWARAPWVGRAPGARSGSPRRSGLVPSPSLIARAPRGLRVEGPVRPGLGAPSLHIPSYLPDLRLPPPDPFLPLPSRNLDRQNKGGIFDPSCQCPVPASSAVGLKMSDHACQIAQGHSPTFLLISGLSACVLEILLGSVVLSLLLQLELLNAQACKLPVAYFCVE